MILGAQLYTVRSRLTNEQETEQTLKEIKEIGYDSVQLFGSVELIENCAKYSIIAGLSVVGVLVDMNFCEKYEQELFGICKKYNIPDLGISSSHNEYQDPKAYIERVHSFARKVKAEGLTFSYHNHGHEFVRLLDGRTAMSHFLEKFDPSLVDFMPDTYWLHDGGYDVRYFLEETKDRVKILHLKDLKRLEQGHTYAEIGNGNLCFKKILKLAENLGIEQYVVEQDVCPADPVDSLRTSYNYLKSL